jgi:hypothetical protein
MDPASQSAPDDFNHFIYFQFDLHVDLASINAGYDPIVYRPCFDLGGQLWLALRTQPGNPLSATVSNQLKGVGNGKPIN